VKPIEAVESLIAALDVAIVVTMGNCGIGEERGG